MDSSYSGYWLIVSTVFTKQGLIIIFIIILKLMLCSVWVSTKIFPYIILPQETLTPHLIGVPRDDPNQDQWCKVTWIMVHQLNWLILYQSFTRLYLLVPLMHYDLRYPRSLILIWIIPIECSLRQCQAQTCPERKKERLKVSKGKKTPTRGSVVHYFFKCNQVSPVKTHHSTADYK